MMHDLTNPKTFHLNLSEIKSHRRILRRGIGRSPWLPYEDSTGREQRQKQEDHLQSNNSNPGEMMLVWTRLVHNCLSLNAFISPIALLFKVLYSIPVRVLVDKKQTNLPFFHFAQSPQRPCKD